MVTATNMEELQRAYLEGEKSVLVYGRKADTVYEVNEKGVLQITRIIPHEGYNLYKVSGSLAKTTPPTTKYYLAENPKDAIAQFEHIHSFKAKSVTEVTERAEIEDVLTDWRKMPHS